jgi:hypothetical protein
LTLGLRGSTQGAQCNSLGNAPGNKPTTPAALKARHKLKRFIAAPEFPSLLRAFSALTIFNLDLAVGPGFYIARRWRSKSLLTEIAKRRIVRNHHPR